MMHPSVPIAALLASFGTYGLVMSIIALRNPEKLSSHHSNLQEPIEWIAVLLISLFGMIGSAVGLAAQLGSPPWLPFLIATPIVGALGVGFFKMLEISPIPVFAMLVNTRLLGPAKRRRRWLDEVRMTWAESSIDGNVLEEQARINRKSKARGARRGAMTLATIITGMNLLWLGKLVVSLNGSLIFLALILPLYIGLVIVLTRAGRSVAARGKDINWKQPF